jgi:hypothetical protein
MSSNDEQFRHRCEVRWLIAERAKRGKAGRQWLQSYLLRDPVQPRRKQLESDIMSQWTLGNRGEWGRWEVDSNWLF